MKHCSKHPIQSDQLNYKCRSFGQQIILSGHWSLGCFCQKASCVNPFPPEKDAFEAIAEDDI